MLWIFLSLLPVFFLSPCPLSLPSLPFLPSCLPSFSNYLSVHLPTSLPLTYLHELCLQWSHSLIWVINNAIENIYFYRDMYRSYKTQGGKFAGREHQERVPEEGRSWEEAWWMKRNQSDRKVGPWPSFHTFITTNRRTVINQTWKEVPRLPVL